MRDVLLEVSSDLSLLPTVLLELMSVAPCLSGSTTSGEVARGSCLVVGVPGEGGDGRLGWLRCTRCRRCGTGVSLGV